MENQTMEDLHKAMDTHIKHHPDPKRGMKHLQQLFMAKPDVRPVTQLLPVDEMEIRHEYLQKIEKGQRAFYGNPNWEFTPSQYITLMNLPLEKLAENARLDAEALSIYLKHIGRFLAHFFQRRQPEDGFTEPAGSSIGTPLSVRKSTQQKRSYGDTGESQHKRIRSETAISEVKLPEAPAGRPQERASSVELEQKAPVLPASGPAKISLTPSATKTQPTRVYRSHKMRNLAKDYDKHRCVITGSANPQGCHIIPFTWNSTLQMLETARDVSHVISEFFSPDDLHMLVLLWSNLGSSDRDWNILDLSAQLHIWWGKGYFGLKYLGHEVDQEDPEMSRVELQFVWMPHSHFDKETKQVNLNETKGNIRSCLEHMFGGEPPCSPHCSRCITINKVQAHKVREHHTIESGYVFPVLRKTVDVQKFIAMIQIQWAAICVGSISGAAKHPELLVGDDDEDDDDNQPSLLASVDDKVKDWLELVQQSGDEESS
ncbi:unnamed protein product [Clonostachys rosea f. rosea IK726]|uniref:Uncharacterized protein n=1 Tax=Clonostachys rosea f. rosea IK726 TaxID=1349383 RepID=A0ACA9TY84_BIOOC|nr:unnamed protein product [Clonostachys rosea f. rosea IK726]